jgi:hypothetical protein
VLKRSKRYVGKDVYAGFRKKANTGLAITFISCACALAIGLFAFLSEYAFGMPLLIVASVVLIVALSICVYWEYKLTKLEEKMYLENMRNTENTPK